MVPASRDEKSQGVTRLKTDHPALREGWLVKRQGRRAPRTAFHFSTPEPHHERLQRQVSYLGHDTAQASQGVAPTGRSGGPVDLVVIEEREGIRAIRYKHGLERVHLYGTWGGGMARTPQEQDIFPSHPPSSSLLSFLSKLA